MSHRACPRRPGPSYCAGVFAALGFLPGIGPWLDAIGLMTGDPAARSLASVALTTLLFAGLSVSLGIQLERILANCGVRLTRLPDEGRDYWELDRSTPPDNP